MKGDELQKSYNMDGGEILIIGNPSALMKEAISTDISDIRVCGSLDEGLKTAGQSHFKTIAIEMNEIKPSTREKLVSLRKKTSAKILLLARMYEEPDAIKLVGNNGNSIADDYLICPIQTERLYNIAPLSPNLENKNSYDNTALLERINRLEKLATEDDLTNLKNRRYLWEFAKQIIARAKKENGRVTVLAFDIDDFKHYNDVYGHAAGDEVLKQASMLIKRCCRKHDVVARLGGDEFAAVFWDDPQGPQPAEGNERRSYTMDHPKEAIFIAKRFRRELEKTNFQFLGPDGRGVLTISGGLASFNRDGSTAEQLFERADQALLEAKRSGKNRIYLVGQPQNDIEKIE